MKLSVVIPNRNDSVMLAITVRSCLEELLTVPGGGEVVIVDNSDQDVWKALSTVNESPMSLSYVEEDKVRLIRQPYPGLYAARGHAILASRGEYVCNIDSHMVLGRDSLKDLVAFLDSTKEQVGYAFAPVGWLGQHECLSRHDIRTDEASVFGNWGRKYEEPTKICWNFGFKTSNRVWHNEVLGGYRFYAREKVSWGGGEMYVALKSWLLGYPNWAVPCRPHYHIGPFSDSIQRLGYKYRLYGSSGQGQVGLGVLAAFYALGGEDGKEEAYRAGPVIKKNYGVDVDRDWPEARRLAHDDWLWLKDRQVIEWKEFLEKKPWMEGWGDDRWTSWKPWKDLKKVQDLNKLPTVDDLQ